jgi:tellurite resistance protein TerC
MMSIGTPWLWGAFSAVVLVMLALDLGVFHRKAHEVRFRESLIWTLVWIALSLVFCAAIFYFYGSEKALEFLAGYVIEKALSVDNIFVFVILFSSFAVPKIYQHRVLFWGVIGAILLRAIFIAAGAALIHRFAWIMYIFGAILVVTGVKLLTQKTGEVHPERNPIFRIARKVIPAVPEYDGQKFFTIRNGKRFATPLFIVLLAVEATDVVFAVDSIPAIFAVTLDPFIVYTSNVFAILGLRALYSMLGNVLDRFRYLNIGLACVLMFVGAKMLLAGFYKVPIAISLGVIALLIGGSIVISWMTSAKTEADV